LVSSQNVAGWSFGFLLALANGLALGRVLAGPGFTAWSIVVYVACCGLFLLVWSMYVYTIAPLITVRSTKRMIQKGQYLGVVGRHTVRLEAEGFHETTDVSKSFHAWRSIDTLAADAVCLHRPSRRFGVHHPSPSLFKIRGIRRIHYCCEKVPRRRFRSWGAHERVNVT
jgi:hypothetical protein